MEIDDVKQLERATTCLRDRLLIKILFHLGCRISEALHLEVKDINFAEGTLTIEHLKVRLDGSYLAQALRACGGMVDFKLTNAYSPTLFTTDGYQLVVMPMLTDESNRAMKADREAKQAEPTQSTEPVAEAVTEAEVIAEAVAEVKPKHSRKRDKVAVA